MRIRARAGRGEYLRRWLPEVGCTSDLPLVREVCRLRGALRRHHPMQQRCAEGRAFAAYKHLAALPKGCCEECQGKSLLSFKHIAPRLLHLTRTPMTLLSIKPQCGHFGLKTLWCRAFLLKWPGAASEDPFRQFCGPWAQKWPGAASEGLFRALSALGPRSGQNRFNLTKYSVLYRRVRPGGPFHASGW